MNSRVIAVLAALGLTLTAIAASRDAIGLTKGHGLLHVNCPPGSHGQPRFGGEGQRLQQARDAARAARSLADRSVTAR